MYIIIIKEAMYCPEQNGTIFGGWEFETEEQAEENRKFYAHYFPNLWLQVIKKGD